MSISTMKIDEGTAEEMMAAQEALGWALDLAHDDQQHYMRYGQPYQDYGDEWPEVAKQKAAYCRSIAEMSLLTGEAERWNALAQMFENSI